MTLLPMHISRSVALLPVPRAIPMRPAPTRTRVVSLFSILALLALLAQGEAAYALELELKLQPNDMNAVASGIISNVSATAESGNNVSGGASVTGNTSASVDVRNIIRSAGSNTQIDINIRTEADGEAYATSVSRILERGMRLDVNSGEETEADVSVEMESATEDDVEAPPGLASIFGRFYASLERMAEFIFFFW